MPAGRGRRRPRASGVRAAVGNAARTPRRYRDLRRSSCLRLLPGRRPGGDRAGGDLRPAGDGIHDAGHHHADPRGERHRGARRVRVRPVPGPPRPRPARSRSRSSAGSRRSSLPGGRPTGPRSGSRPTLRACAWARRSRPGARSSATCRRRTGSAEFFGLWGLAVKLSSILGPLTYGPATWLSGGDHRLAILLTGVFFVAGLAVLATIDVRRGRREAMRAGRRPPARASAATGRS